MNEIKTKKAHCVRYSGIEFKGGRGKTISATTYLRNVLIQRMGQVGHAVDVAPIKGGGQVRQLDVGVRQGRRVAVVDGTGADLLGGEGNSDGGKGPVSNERDERQRQEAGEQNEEKKIRHDCHR